MVFISSYENALRKTLNYSSLNEGVLIGMCNHRTFQYAVWKTEIPDTQFIYDFWKTKSEALKAVVGNEESICEQFGKEAFLAIKDEFVIARHYAKIASIRLYTIKKEREMK